jgi:hypothetical protein
MTTQPNPPPWNKGLYWQDSKSTRMAKALEAVAVGGSVADLIHSRVDQSRLVTAARRRGIKVRTEKLNTGGWKVWRLS